MSLPATFKGLVLSSFKDPIDIALKTLPMPSITPGSAIVQVLTTRVHKEAQVVYSGARGFPMSLPMVPGTGSIVRIAALGSDAVTLSPGQLAYVDITVHARDDPSITMLQGFMAFGPSKKLMDGEWRNGALAEYMKVPLENIHPLDEDLLINRMGYTLQDLIYITTLVVPYGGLADINVKPGESILVAPATGTFGGAAVTVALGLGARVIAAGRNESKLKKLVEVFGPIYGDRLSYVQLTGDVAADSQAIQKTSPGGKGVDCYIDFSPPAAATSTHIKTCLMALKTNGRASIMGGIQADVGIPYFLVVMKSLKLMGKLMYERKDVTALISMVEAGLIPLGAKSGIQIGGTYKLEDAEVAFDTANKHLGFGVEFAFQP